MARILAGSFIILSSVLYVMLMFGEKEEKSESLVQQNDYPIVFVHGLAGWGRDEVFGLKYWGGLNDFEAHLNAKGYTAFTAAVGPISSNYDRAVELYYYIKGGTVDYGAYHAEKYGHSRYGRTFKGIYPEWDGQHPIHLIGHSMGGLTNRALVDLLIDGNAEEQAYAAANPGMGLSSLYDGNRHWVHSVTTIGTPHNGSTFAESDNVLSLFIKELVLEIAALSGGDFSAFDYDFKLDHWGIKRGRNEDFEDYLQRVMNNSIWSSEDMSIHDLDTNGAAYNNEWLDTHEDVYYFSHTGQTTFQNRLTGHHMPNLLTNPIMVQPALFIGSYSRIQSGPFIDESWWPNDGLVSTISSLYPFHHPAALYKPGNEIKKGIWNYYPIRKEWDHLDQMGLTVASYVLPNEDMNDFYEEVARHLLALPAR